MRFFQLVLLSLAVSLAGFGQQQKAATKTAPKAAVKQAQAKALPLKQNQAKALPVKPLPGKQVATKQVAAKGAPKQLPANRGKQAYVAPRRVVPRYYVQMQPSPDRYKDIQTALSSRGYFSGPVDGVWGASSAEALKRFQHDQNLAEEGKIDSLSLIALGLGPKRTATAVPPTPTSP